jgi:hypothetical protein
MAFLVTAVMSKIALHSTRHALHHVDIFTISFLALFLKQVLHVNAIIHALEQVGDQLFSLFRIIPRVLILCNVHGTLPTTLFTSGHIHVLAVHHHATLFHLRIILEVGHAFCMAAHEKSALHAFFHGFTRVVIMARATTFHALMNFARVVFPASLLTFLIPAFIRVVHAVFVALHKALIFLAAVTAIAREFLVAMATALHALALLARIELHAGLRTFTHMFPTQGAAHTFTMAHHETLLVHALFA